jgi:hypothetical protein
MNALLRCIERWTQLAPEGGGELIVDDAPQTPFSEELTDIAANYCNQLLPQRKLHPLDEINSLILWKFVITRTGVKFVFTSEAEIPEEDRSRFYALYKRVPERPGFLHFTNTILAASEGDPRYILVVGPQGLVDAPNDDPLEFLEENLHFYDITFTYEIQNVPANRQKIATLITEFGIQLDFRDAFNDPAYTADELTSHRIYTAPHRMGAACATCSKPATFTCSACNAPYCSEKCQQQCQ